MADLTLTRGVSGGGLSASNSSTYTAGSLLVIQETVADGQTNKAVTGTADVSAMKALYIHSDQDVTLETNDGTTPDDAFTLNADQPILWGEDDSADNPLTVDVTGFFVTNASGAAATVTIAVLQDPTP